MIPGELIPAPGEIELNAGRPTLRLTVANTGDRPIQVGSHYHFFETNAALRFDRVATRGYRLNIAAGTAVRFEPGQEREVELVALGGDRIVYGFQGRVMGPLDARAGGRKAAPAARRAAKAAAGKAASTAAAPRSGRGSPAPAPQPGRGKPRVVPKRAGASGAAPTGTAPGRRVRGAAGSPAAALPGGQARRAAARKAAKKGGRQ